MYCVTVALGNAAWRLMFKAEEKAKLVFDSLTPRVINGPAITVEDDYGQICTVIPSSTHGLMFEDLDKAKMASVELFLHQQRTQAMATKAAQSDPGLRAASAMNGPAVLTPMGGNYPRN